jgi:hypothetical protein
MTRRAEGYLGGHTIIQMSEAFIRRSTKKTKKARKRLRTEKQRVAWLERQQREFVPASVLIQGPR